ncbi:hypothetical protein BDN70DRAFT_424394 [Pholiota conissans]|uniref:Uncharacterized protein n=1 Tax=Pholiota conissans TaxID=109636 RepID=A0A9P6CTD0_9AGAR|nr:hypothetical protein BDN70DRAFT_424394 [Pholiota conissans]
MSCVYSCSLGSLILMLEIVYVRSVCGLPSFLCASLLCLELVVQRARNANGAAKMERLDNGFTYDYRRDLLRYFSSYAFVFEPYPLPHSPSFRSNLTLTLPSPIVPHLTAPTPRTSHLSHPGLNVLQLDARRD